MKKTRFIPLLALGAIIAVVAFVAGRVSEKKGETLTQHVATLAKTPPSTQKPANKRKILYWRSSMDPSYVFKKPGKDAMGMDLVPVYANEPSGKKGPAPAKSPEAKRKVLYYRDPMDPNFVSNKPGKAPCGMDLVPVYADEATSGKIHISSEVTQQIGVTTTKVTSGPFAKTIQTYGTTTWNETTLAALNTKINGWIEKLDVNVMGQVVRKGQPLIRIYSPELLSAQREYLAALDNAKALEGSPLRVMAAAAARLPEAARMRLKLWDISDQQIAELRATRKVRKDLTLYAPISGIVTKLDVMQGDYVQSGRNLMKIAGLDPIWVMGSLYEDQIPMVKRGMMATVAFDSLPGESFQGKVDYVYPFVAGKSRTAQVRIVLPNPGDHILPQMYGTVKLIVPISDCAIQIPSDSVIRSSSTDNLVFIALGKGEFAGRKVILGPEGDKGMVMVRAGLKAGERIVTSAQFLLDAESRLNSAAQSMLSNGGSSK
ncbi:MAG: efflux RND transporter periplasmic adaptor subunit [Syntrophobacteraceae bacterium]